MGQRVLVVEDDRSIRRLLEEELRFQGYEVEAYADGLAGYEAFSGFSPDLVILDLMLPSLSGLAVCQRLRADQCQAPILLLTARDQEVEKVRGLDAGADDYITKPFSVAELMARVRAHLRAQTRQASPEATTDLADLQINRGRMQVLREGKRVDLTRKELEILILLAEDQEGVVTRDAFLEALWPDVYVTPRTIDTHVSTLRRKLGLHSSGEDYILGVRGVGYRLNPAVLELRRAGL